MLYKRYRQGYSRHLAAAWQQPSVHPGKGQSIFYSSSYSFTPEKIEYSETDDKKSIAAYYTFEKVTDKRTGLTIDLYIKKNPLLLAVFNLLEKKARKVISAIAAKSRGVYERGKTTCQHLIC